MILDHGTQREAIGQVSRRGIKTKRQPNPIFAQSICEGRNVARVERGARKVGWRLVGVVEVHAHVKVSTQGQLGLQGLEVPARQGGDPHRSRIAAEGQPSHRRHQAHAQLTADAETTRQRIGQLGSENQVAECLDDLRVGPTTFADALGCLGGKTPRVLVARGHHRPEDLHELQRG